MGYPKIARICMANRLYVCILCGKFHDFSKIFIIFPAIQMQFCSLPLRQEEFRADRPFIFFIQDRSNDRPTILFKGRMLNPNL